MNTYIPSREDAYILLKKYNKKEGLIRHALSVESVMAHFARHFNEDEEKWRVIGLVHDLDYEMYPQEHCHKCVELFKEYNWPEDYIRAVVSHGWGICTDVKPETNLEKTLYAIDELTGLVASSALVRPSKSILDIKAKSVKKKFKDKRFAAAVDRQVILNGAKFLDMDLSELITQVILGMRPVAEKIGLKGNL
ncbi:MAG: HDIG domain-containing protein [Desulfobacula sp.]|jgi:putative nucleotidyltransferase with HDIG domain|uniref:HDIG domain-containing metalloprotein n=1 Tax=Desulfobacula sp. TaxID=2593537 RepID=UPI001DBD51BD|nr:HDIG domain-containing protein [Desulfobacula sp.]MBT7049665.1 HDIG domain-containing protein [Desulfobacula sp.]MBT7631323.1 HDIG domain-containing protein [Desulfobacula sp.]